MAEPSAGSGKDEPQERASKSVQDPSLELAQPGEKGYAMRGPGGKLFHDGAGLCSQGNKRPAFRDISVMASLGEEFLKLTSEDSMRRDLYRLALGKCESPPFGKDTVDEARRLWLRSLAARSGKTEEDLAEVDEHQPFFLAAVHEHLKVIGDPDAEAFRPDTFRTGVPIGVDGMPRAPDVFEAKEKWRRYDPIPWPTDKANYTSAADNAAAVQLQFRKEEALGAMVEVEEELARVEYGD